MTSRSQIAGITIALLALSGCMAAKGSIEVVRADEAVRRAEERGAAEHAIYEHTLSQRYLEKAHEELGRNDFRDATELARSAAPWMNPNTSTR